MSNIIHQANNNVNSSGLKIIFMGTPEFAVPILENLANSEYKPVAVFCAPDKPVGRKQILTPPPVKVLAQKYNIFVWQSANSHELVQTIKSLPCDLIITAAYGLILPKEVLDAPQYGCLNIHPSLLPKYRGPSPIQSVILNGDTETGVTIFKMDEQIDHGPILITNHLSLTTKRFTTLELSQKLSELGAELLLKTLPDWIANKIEPKPQNDQQATFTKIIKKEDGKIDWQKSTAEIERQIRAFTPWPGSYTTIPNYSPSKVEGSKLKIIKADFLEKNSGKKIGEVFLTDNGKLAIQCNQGYLIIENLQLEGSKPLSASDFLLGHKDIIGKILI